MKTFCTIVFSLVVFNISVAQDMVLSASLIDDSKIADDGLYFDGTQGVNYQFSPRISPHGDCIDVVNGYVFVTWYKGGMDKRNLMLSRKKLDDPTANWITIEFPHKHIGYQGNPAIGDSHNTAAIGVSTIDGTIHLLYDMHAYRESSFPNDFFNYSVSIPNAAFVPDAQFNLSLFNPKRNYLKSGEDYDRITYPMLHRADDGSLLVRYRIGGSGNGDIFMAHYDGNTWTDNWLYSDGTIPLPNRYSLYGGEKFLNGKFYSGFSIRYADNPNYNLNSGLYFAYTNDIPKNQSSPWFDVNNNPISIPIGIPDNVKVAEPGDDYGTASAPRTSSDPSFTVTENGAIHFITRVDNINVHYYKAPGASTFSSAGGGLIPDPEVRGDIFSYKNHVFMAELLGGELNIKSTLEGQNDWKIAYSSTEPTMFMHFDAFVENDKLYVYLMENTSGDARPLHLQVFSLSEIEDTGGPGEADIIIEAEDYDTGGQGVGYNDLSTGNSGGVYRTDDVDIEANAAASNGYAVVEFQGAEWLKYTFQVATAGVYEFTLTAANRNRDDSIMDIEINGVLYDDVLITRTFDWNVFLETKIPNITLSQGGNVIKITQRRSLSSTPDKLEFVLTSALNTAKFKHSEISVYPNPSHGIFNIKTSLQNPNYTLMTLQGQVVGKGVVRQKELNLSKCSKGVYFLELASEGSRLVKKIVIN